MVKPSVRYKDKLTEHNFEPDPLQQQVITQFDLLYDHITKKRSWFSSKIKTKGVYLWGPVGRGKTMIIDLLLESLPSTIIHQRYHYHAFMRMIHKELKLIQGQKDPLTIIAKKLKKQMQILFLDEFFVLDMANAMILGDLLKAFFKENLILLTTSNCAPDELYKDGMFRERFLPAIEAIKENMQVLSLCSDNDYRMKQTLLDHRFITPIDDKTAAMLRDIFHHLTKGTVITNEPLICLDRLVKVIARSDEVIWFDFDDICSIPRSQNDYLVIAEDYDTFLISNIPVFTDKNADAGLYFTMLIDVLYDEQKQIIMSASKPLEDIFPHTGPLALGFERTYSRLIEMQSPEYCEQ